MAIRKRRYVKESRQKRREYFEKQHFTKREALELSRLHRKDYFELIGTKQQTGMIEERRRLWEAFDEDAKRSRGRSYGNDSRVWKDFLTDWYTAKGFVPKLVKLGAWKFSTHKDDKQWRAKRVWIWFNAIRDSLPEELQCDSPGGRDHRSLTWDERRHKSELEAIREKDKMPDALWQEKAMEGVVKHPQTDRTITDIARSHGFKGKSLYKTALRRGFRA